MRKIFVLDTNILIHDPKCIYNFRGNDVILPIYVVEEIDKLKRYMETDEYTEEVAREKLGLVKDNETVFKKEQ